MHLSILSDIQNNTRASIKYLIYEFTDQTDLIFLLELRCQSNMSTIFGDHVIYWFI